MRNQDQRSSTEGKEATGIHRVRGVLVIGAGTILLSAAMLRGGFGKAAGAIGITTGIISFPSLLSSEILAVATILFPVWFILGGWRRIKFTAGVSLEQKNIHWR